MFHYYALYKPFQVLSQFTPEADKLCLKNIIDVPSNVYPLGRLDYDSEGLLLLTNDASVNAKLLHPKTKHSKTYWVQVEGAITPQAIQQLAQGVSISINGKQHTTLPAKVKILPQEPLLPPRSTPIRFRKNIPTSWVSITLHEGKNRQVRKMTAAVGFPTLRLVRYSMEKITIENMQPADLVSFSQKEFFHLLGW
ncbi:MAG: pseudouridine synthase [Bacteroidetes bacterium]|nr:MAG: pseudouridine synthase [Bacteroidota bacterium]TAE68683.1 MAG: pseudouridine synthase [Bacteroidota bacterium]TAF93120.1 MAG: pseudouridine synthase [Bacteroidota bacterium]